MYRRPRRKPYVGWIAAILAAAVLGAAVYGLVKLFSGNPALDSESAHLPSSNPPASVFAWTGGVIFVDKEILTCTDVTGKSKWSYTLPAENMKAARVGKLTVAWGGATVLPLDENGTLKSQPPAITGDIVMAAPGTDYYAVVSKEENQHRLRIYTVKDGKQVDEEPFPYQSVLGMGFFGDNLSQLWILVVDTHGTEPVTKLKTYYPGKYSSGGIVLNNEIGYAAFPEDKLTYLVGTHTLSYWERASEMKDSKLIYGWNLQDALPDGNGNVEFLFAPSSADNPDQISALWYVNTSGTEYRMPLPAGCFKAMLQENGKICVATRNGVWSMADNGTGSRFYPIARTVESIAAVIPGKAFVMQEQHRNYLITMP